MATWPPLVHSDVDSEISNNRVLARKSIDLTGMLMPSYTSVTPTPITPQHSLTFVVPPSGWVRFVMNGIGWCSAVNVKENWCLIVGGTDKILRSEMTMFADTTAQMATFEMVTNMKGQSTFMVPGETLTVTWCWLVPADGTAGTISFDNSVSTMAVYAAPVPTDPTLAPGWPIAPEILTGENLTTVGASGPSVTPTFASTPPVGDLLLCVFMANIVSTSWVLPSGWAIARAIRVGTAGARYIGLCWKYVSAGGEPTANTFTGTGATISAAHMFSKRSFTSVPTVEQSTASSQDAFTGGNLDGTTVTAAPTYAISFVGLGALATITRVGNGWEPLFNDAAVSTAMAASEKTLRIGAKTRINPAVDTSGLAGLGTVVFTGV